MLRRHFLLNSDNTDTITVTYTASEPISYMGSALQYYKNKPLYIGNINENISLPLYGDITNSYLKFLGEDYNPLTGIGHYYFYTSHPGLYSAVLADAVYEDNGEFDTLDPIFSYAIAFWQYAPDGLDIVTDKTTVVYNTIEFSNNITHLISPIFHAIFYTQGQVLNIKLPNSLKYIGANVFANANQLKNIDIPDNVFIIDNQAFYACPDLETVNLGKNVQSIGTEAFLDCSSLHTITGGDNISYIGKDAFKFTKISTSDSTQCLGKFLLTIGNTEEILNIPNVTQMCEFRTSNSQGNTSVYEFYAPNITNIDNYCFYNNTNLHTIDISNVQTIGKYAFSNCSSIQSLIIPESCNDIKLSAFSGLTALKYFEFNARHCVNFVLRTNEPFGSSVTYAEQIVIGDTVEYLPSFLFKSATYTTTQIQYKGTPQQWEALVANSSTTWNKSKNITEVVCNDGTIISLV